MPGGEHLGGATQRRRPRRGRLPGTPAPAIREVRYWRPVVVQFEYPDAPKGARDWWLVSENGEIDLCLNDPGYDVDIVITCSLKTMTEIWVCQRHFRDAVKQGDIKVTGDPKLTNKLQDWLRSSPLSKLGALGKSPKLDWNPG